MNFDFSELQKEFANQVGRALAKTCPMSEVRRVADQGATYSRAAWLALGELGAVGAGVPEEFGGVGLGVLESCVVAEQIGRALAPVPFLSSAGIVIPALLRYGSEKQKERWLPDLASGFVIGCLADTERPGQVSPKTVSTRFEAGRIIGQKPVVFDGMAAGIAVVLAKDEGDMPCLCLVDLDQPTVTRERVMSIDAATSVASLSFKDAKAEKLEGQADWSSYLRLLDAAAVLAAFEALGAAESALAAALGYSKQRKAFGRDIASYQSIKHKLARGYVNIQIARANCYFAAWAVSAGDAAIRTAASAALLSALDAFSYASRENNQVHGGVCFTWEADCHFFYKRAKVLATRLGAPSEWKARLVENLIADVRVGNEDRALIGA